MFAFAVGTMSDSMEGGLINTLFPVISQALNLEVGAGHPVQHEQVGPHALRHRVAIIGDRVGRKKVMVWMTGVWGLWTAQPASHRTSPSC
jgi:hypothetical protein